MYIDFNPLTRFFNKHKEFFLKHKDKFWWLHSIWALVFGIGVMWLGKNNFNYIRLAIVQIIFIWLSSLGAPVLLSHNRLDFKWKHRIRLLINYFNRNFYQQMLFFVLPMYYLSTTLDSPNVIFIILIAFSAILSTMDIVYDRYISVKGTILSLFFAFNLFVCINVMLPFLWRVRGEVAIRVSGLVALLGFASFCYRLTNLKRTKKAFIILASTLLIVLVSEAGRPLIPPAPVRLDRTQFSRDLNRDTINLINPLERLPLGNNQIVVLSHIKAPWGFRESVRHFWFLDGYLVHKSTAFQITGQGGWGFRFWTFATLENVKPGAVLRIDLRTGAGQLIGRARLRAPLNGPGQ